MDYEIGSGIRRRSRPVTKLGVTTKFRRNKIAMFLVIFIVIILVLVSIYMVFSRFNDNNSDKENSSMLSDEEKIIGTWKYTETYEGQTIVGFFNFLSDKSCEYSASADGNTQTLTGSWDINGNKLVLSFEGVETETTDYVFSDDNEKLTLTDDGGITRVLTRQ